MVVWIEGYSETRFPEAAGRVVIRHRQKSREYKGMVDAMEPTRREGATVDA